VQENCANAPNERPENLPKCDEMELTTTHIEDDQVKLKRRKLQEETQRGS